MKEKIQITFAGISFTGYGHPGGHITVPKNIMPRILMSKFVQVRCRYHNTDDYAHDAATNHGARDNVSPQILLDDWYKVWGGWKRQRPWLLYYSPENHTIRYCPQSNSSYEIKETTP